MSTFLFGLFRFILYLIALGCIIYIARHFIQKRQRFNTTDAFAVLGVVLSILGLVNIDHPSSPNLPSPTPTAVDLALAPTTNSSVPTDIPVPTKAPTLTPTPYKPKTSQERALRDYLELRKQGKYEDAVKLVSNYSKNYHRFKDEDVIRTLRDRYPIIDYEIVESQSINHETLPAVIISTRIAYTDGVKALVKFILVQEENEHWRVNHGELISYREIAEDSNNPQEIKDVIVKVVSVGLFDGMVGVTIDITNNNTNRSAFFGYPGIAPPKCIIRFDTGKAPEDKERCQKEINPNSTEELYLLFDDDRGSYPTGIELYGWILSEENNLTTPDVPPELWSYQFKLEYTP